MDIFPACNCAASKLHADPNKWRTPWGLKPRLPETRHFPGTLTEGGSKQAHTPMGPETTVLNCARVRSYYGRGGYGSTALCLMHLTAPPSVPQHCWRLAACSRPSAPRPSWHPPTPPPYPSPPPPPQPHTRRPIYLFIFPPSNSSCLWFPPQKASEGIPSYHTNTADALVFVWFMFLARPVIYFNTGCLS